MSVGAQPLSADVQAAGVTQDMIWRLSVNQYHEMMRSGILADGDPIELLEGCLVGKMPKNRPHVVATGCTRDEIAAVLPEGWYVDTQEPVTTQDSEPEPDVAVIRGARRDCPDRHPSPKDAALVVEVADASLERDGGLKKRIYARANVPCYWIVNLIDRRVEVYTQPTGEADVPEYRRRDDFNESQSIPLVIDGREVAQIPVKGLLP